MNDEIPKILIVDDDPVFQKLMHKLLPQYDYQVLSVYSGNKALEKVFPFSPDIILLDIRMPNGIDGHEVCRQLKKDHRTQDIPVIFVTASSKDIDKVQGLSLGAVDYIYKPFPSAEILARIGMHLKNSSLRKNIIIKREIEFIHEHHQAGVGVLSHFGTVLRNKYPNEKVKIRIEQYDSTVSMIVETQKGNKEIIEREFHEYGRVVTGDMTPEEFYQGDRLAAIELKAQLCMLKTQLETQKMILEEKNRVLTDKNRQIERYHSLILGFQRIILTATQNPLQFELIQNNSTEVSQSTVIELTSEDQTQIINLVDAIERNLDEFKVSQGNEKKVVELIGSIKEDLKKDNPDFFGVKDNLNSVNTLLQGAAGSVIASGLFPVIERVISGIFG